MSKEAINELRNIRITLVILTIFFVFSGCGRDQSVVDNTEDISGTIESRFQYSNMVELGDGNFGVLSGDSSNGVNGQEIKVYHYNETTNKLEYRTSKIIEE
ncbi:hypothetical protein [Bacillus massiliigorillae]|uniref:hypothetical protein n=1 Tax=Bacillus massiliigorillae TaxID=1243664 RepID=UPI0003A653AC|nr:hypothetical protein [Bacillus massiliigorillae]